MDFHEKAKEKIKKITPVTIFYKYTKRVLKGYSLYRKLVKEYGEGTWILVAPWPGTGDAFQTGRYFKAFLEKNAIEKFVMVVGNSGVKRVLDLFEIPNIKVLCFDDTESLSHLLQFVGKSAIKLRLLHHNPPEMYSSMMRSIEGINKYTWGEMFRDIGMGLNSSVRCYSAKFSSDMATIEEYFLKNNLRKGKTVVLSPYANTFVNMPMEVWTKLTTYLKQLGYDVCTNSTGESEPVLEGTKRFFFSYADTVPALEYAGYFIGIRSGLCDIISEAKCKKIVIYQPIRCGFGPVIDLFNMKQMKLCEDAEEFELVEGDVFQNITKVLSCFEDAHDIVNRIEGKNMTKFEYKVSVIIPAYNAEKYLFRCLKSIQSQTLNDIEIIVIDNGSTDKTSDIIDEFAAFDRRFKKVVIKENEGVSKARNTGIEIAKGEYIAFSDADDEVPPGAYETMYRKARSDVADVVVGNYFEIVDDIWKNFCDAKKSGKEFVTFFAGGVIWNKLYRTAFLADHSILFQKYNFGEDTLFLGETYIHSPCVATTEDDVYHHLQRTATSSTTQLTRQYNAKNLRDYFACGNKVYTMPYSCSREDVYIEYLRYLDYVHHFWWENPKGTEQKDTFEELQTFTTLFEWDSPEKEADFIHIFHMKPKLFQKITYEVYLSFLVTYYHVSNVQSEPIAVSSIEPRVALLEEFQQGKIGFRYIIKYAKAWLRFKIKR